MGHTYAIGDTHLSSQFEAYLSSSTHSNTEAMKYRETIDTILKILQPTSKERNKVKKAYYLLHEAASYPGDGNICDSLSNAIHLVINAHNHAQAKSESLEALDREKIRIQRILKLIEESPDLNTSRKLGSKHKKEDNPRLKSAEYLNYKKRLLEIEVLKKKRSVEENVSLAQAKTHFQAVLLQMFIQRRFEHVVIGCRFHNAIFNDGNGKIQIKEGSDVANFFSKTLGTNPTISGLDSLANEAISKTNSLVSAFRNNIKMGQLHSASSRLLEAYAIGEFVSSVQTLPFEEKQQIFRYVKDSNKLVASIDSKNFSLANELNQSLKSQAEDYNFAKTDAAISAYTKASNAHVNAAYLAFGDKKLDEANDEILIAVQLWPTNPRIKEFQTITETRAKEANIAGDLAVRTRKEFDEAYQIQNYRFIMNEDRLITCTAVFKQTDDQTRMAQLEEVKDIFKTITEALKTAQYYADNRQNYGAWETLYTLENKHKEDKNVRALLTDLETKTGRFINMVTLAKTFKRQGNYGSALTFYLKAKDLYPKSKIAASGIKALVEYKIKGKPVE